MTPFTAWAGAMTSVLVLITILMGHRKFAAASSGTRWMIGLGPIGFLVVNAGMVGQGIVDQDRLWIGLGLFGVLNCVSALYCYIRFMRQHRAAGTLAG